MSQNPRCLFKKSFIFVQILYQIHAQREMDVLLGDFIASHSEYIIKSKRKTWKQKTAPITLYVNMFQSIWPLFKFIWLNWIYFICHTIQPFFAVCCCVFFSLFIHSYGIKSHRGKDIRRASNWTKPKQKKSIFWVFFTVVYIGAYKEMSAHPITS